jgi:hypothetical protein
MSGAVSQQTSAISRTKDAAREREAGSRLRVGLRLCRRDTDAPFIVCAVLACVALMIVAGCDRGSTEPIELLLKLKPGRTYTHLVRTEQTSKHTMRGQTQTTEMETEYGYSYRVDAVDEAGVATLTIRLESLRMEQDTPMGSMKFDSAHPPEEPIAETAAYAAMLGASFVAQVDRRGAVLSVSGVDKIHERIDRALEPFGAMKRIPIGRALKAQFSEEALAQSVTMILAVYPEEPVRPGDSWSRSTAMMGGFPMAMDNHWTLESVRDGVARVSVNTEVSSPMGERFIVTGTSRTKYDVSGTQTGTLEFDVQSGWITSADMRQEMSGTLTMVGGQFGNQPVEGDVSLTGRIRIRPIPR